MISTVTSVVTSGYKDDSKSLARAVLAAEVVVVKDLSAGGGRWEMWMKVKYRSAHFIFKVHDNISGEPTTGSLSRTEV